MEEPVVHHLADWFVFPKWRPCEIIQQFYFISLSQHARRGGCLLWVRVQSLQLAFKYSNQSEEWDEWCNNFYLNLASANSALKTSLFLLSIKTSPCLQYLNSTEILLCTSSILHPSSIFTPQKAGADFGITNEGKIWFRVLSRPWVELAICKLRRMVEKHSSWLQQWVEVRKPQY